MRELYEAHADAPRIRFHHLTKYQRNAEIVRPHSEGETLSTIAKDFGVSEQRVWRIARRHG